MGADTGGRQSASAALTDVGKRRLAERSFASYVRALCDEHATTWEELSRELGRSGFGDHEIPGLIRSGWVAVVPDPSQLSVHPRPASRDGMLVPRGVIKQVDRFVAQLMHPAGGSAAVPPRGWHPIARLRSRHGIPRSA